MKKMKENKMENLIWIIFASIGGIFLIIGLAVFGNIFVITFVKANDFIGLTV